MNNKKLEKFYNAVYVKGEKKHYSRYNIGASIEFEEVIKAIPWKGKSVLDVGCGTGLFDYLISKRGAKVLAIDYSKKAIEIAKETHHAPNLKFEEGSAMTFKGTYDVIVSLGTLEHMDNPFEILKRFKKHLKPNGHIIITTPNWTNPRGFTLMALKHLFDAPITLADLHYFTPVDFEKWAKKNNMGFLWKTFDRSWAHGPIMIDDLKRRLPNVFRDAKMKVSDKQISNLLTWLKEKVIPMDHAAPQSGAMALYVFKAKK